MKRSAIGLFALTALAIAFAAITASRAAAQDYCSSPGTTCYAPPAAHVTVSNGHNTALNFDSLPYSQLGNALPRIATANVPGA